MLMTATNRVRMMAEATGVFFYVFAGISQVAAFTINKENPAFGSIFNIGWSFAIGIAFAIITCAPTSGGHCTSQFRRHDCLRSSSIYC